MVQPMVPKRRSSNLAKKSMKFREALCVSLIRPNSESYDGGSAVYEKNFIQDNLNLKVQSLKIFRELKLPFGSTASSYEGGGPLETP